MNEPTRSTRTSSRVPKSGLSHPESKQGRLQRACLELLAEHERDGALPTSGQFIWYELVQRGIVQKARAGGRTKRGDKAEVTDALMHLRQQRMVPWSWIVDETRSLSEWQFGETVIAYLQDDNQRARIDLWDGEPPPLLLCESRSLAGVLEPTAAEYLTPIAPTNGQVGGFLHTDVAPVLHDGQRVLYLGDWDWQGLQIEANTRAVLEEYADLEWERLALTEAQVNEPAYDLRSRTIQKADRRYRPAMVYPAVETEALSQQVIVDIVRGRLDELLPAPLELVRRVEELERQQAVALLNSHEEE